MELEQALTGSHTDEVFRAFCLPYRGKGSQTGFYFEDGDAFGVEVTNGVLTKRMTRSLASSAVEIIERVEEFSLRIVIDGDRIEVGRGVWDKDRGCHVPQEDPERPEADEARVMRAILELQLPSLFAAIAVVQSGAGLPQRPKKPSQPFLG